MHLVSSCEQRVLVGGEPIEFADGESILTEYSYKYSLKELEDLKRQSRLPRQAALARRAAILLRAVSCDQGQSECVTRRGGTGGHGFATH